jgi:hypothetical protein
MAVNQQSSEKKLFIDIENTNMGDIPEDSFEQYKRE